MGLMFSVDVTSVHSTILSLSGVSGAIRVSGRFAPYCSLLCPLLLLPLRVWGGGERFVV